MHYKNHVSLKFLIWSHNPLTVNGQYSVLSLLSEMGLKWMKLGIKGLIETNRESYSPK